MTTTATDAMTPATFATDVLLKLGILPTTAAVNGLVAAEQQEGGHWHNTARFNPLNTTLPYGNSAVMAGGNSAGVQAYQSWSDGINATASTLAESRYSSLRQVLETATDPGQVAQAWVDSPWGTHTVTVGGTTYTRNGTPSASSSSPGSGTGSFAAETAGFSLTNPIGSVWDTVEPFLLKSLFALGALGIVVVGLATAVKPAASKAAQTVAPLAEAAAL